MQNGSKRKSAKLVTLFRKNVPLSALRGEGRGGPFQPSSTILEHAETGTVDGELGSRETPLTALITDDNAQWIV
jgi:hypothetical protein